MWTKRQKNQRKPVLASLLDFMKLNFRHIIACTVLCLASFTVAAESTVIYLVRHGEKVEDNSIDPNLTLEGEARAEVYADILKDENMTAVFSTPYIRTRRTAEPTASMHGLAIQEYDPARPTDLVAILETLSGTVLVTGHSNTIPELVNLLTGENMPDLDERVYDRVYRVTLEDGLNTELSITYTDPRTPIESVENTRMIQR